MLHKRVLKTKGNSRAVQVIRYKNGKRIIVKHIGSGKSDTEITLLTEMAQQYINDITNQSILFADGKQQEDVLLLAQIEYLGFTIPFCMMYCMIFKARSGILIRSITCLQIWW